MTRRINVIRRFTVEGAGPFPLDMLRYDRCTPDTEADALRAQDTHGGRRKVVLQRLIDSPFWVPTVGRWESFGWKVVPLYEED